MLEHVGRRSGLKHRTVLEVVDHDRRQGSFIVASGWGRRADWFRNVVHTPIVIVWAGGAVFEAAAQVMGTEAALAAIREYARRSPLAFRMLTRLLLGETEHDAERLCRRMVEEIPLVLLAPAPSAGA
jgi:deazaflavin-dependent oxidoreductase (nitroreductase family)